MRVLLPKRDVIVDTREQSPWDFGGAVKLESRALSTGDYSLRGLETFVAIERKSLEDLTGSIVGERRRRLQEEFERFRDTVKHSYLIAEASIDDLIKHRYRGETNPRSIIGTLISWELRYGVRIVLAGCRPYATAYALSVLRLAETMYERSTDEETTPVKRLRRKKRCGGGATATEEPR